MQKKQKILEFLKDTAYIPLIFDELVTVLDVPESDIELFRSLLDELEADGSIYKSRKNRYGATERMGLISGHIRTNERGYGFVIPDDNDINDVYITADSINGAMNNDRVIIRIIRDVMHAKNAEGEVVKITQRANKTIVGTFEKSVYSGYVIPDDRRIYGDMAIPADGFNGAEPGQKVVAEVLKWPDKRRNAEGRIIEILGHRDVPGTDILSIIRAFNLREDFPPDVESQADAIPDTVTAESIIGRKDFRNLRMVTIDGEDAKDLDDAVSIEKLPGVGYRLGVHIADVSHYVTEGSPLDREALKRGTSVYLVDRAVPMLPPKLSNGICSLNPSVDRLTFSVIMDIDKNGKVISHEITESVIRTDERMTYTDVYRILEKNDEQLCGRYHYLVDDFKMMKELALILRKKRMDRGAIDFDFGESKVILNEKGKPIEVKRYELTIANRIIEEFMLACNETVAEHFYWAEAPFVYRIHEDPELEKIEAFNDFIFNFGYHIKGVKKIHPGALQEIIEQIKGKKEERIISTVMLRSLQKAKYSHRSEGHFGLAAEFYCHFTSPIRRYPDLIIHRIMKEYIKKGLDAQRIEELNEKLPEIARSCSERERDADEAERETEDLKKVEYISQYIGQTFEGIISGVTSFGIFVELDNTVEGLIRMGDLDDDYYVYNEKQYCLVGERTKKVYRIGDTISVKVAKADIAARQVDFVPDEPDGRQTRYNSDKPYRISNKTGNKADNKTGNKADSKADNKAVKNINRKPMSLQDRRMDKKAGKKPGEKTGKQGYERKKQ